MMISDPLPSNSRMRKRANGEADAGDSISSRRRDLLLDRLATTAFILGLIALLAMIVLGVFYPDLAARWR